MSPSIGPKPARTKAPAIASAPKNGDNSINEATNASPSRDHLNGTAGQSTLALPELALEEYRINDCFLKITKESGFSYVNPPLIEFESSLFFLSKEKQKSECFRVLDPLSQKIMAIRSDITSQIARISCGSLLHSKRPLKLCYSGEVLKVKNNNLSMSRQSRQIGAEIIGIKEDFILVDVIKLIVKILDKLNFKNFILNLSMPNLIKAFVEDFQLNADEYEKLVRIIKKLPLFAAEDLKKVNFFKSLLTSLNYLIWGDV